VQDVLAGRDDFQDWFEEKRDPTETFAGLMRVAASETAQDHRTDPLLEVVSQ
jgi:hypothetical protein